MTRTPGLWRHGDFLRLWTGQSVSRLGTEVSLLAIPVAAVVVLHVSAFQAGLLATFEYLPFLLIGLPAGVWVDRLPRRSLLITADVGRALTLGSIPVAGALGRLTIPHLYVASFVAGILTVFFDVAYQAYLPSLVGRDQLVEGNAKLELSSSAAHIVGPGLAGGLIALMGAPLAVTADALSYIWSVAFLTRIRTRERVAVGRPMTLGIMRAEIAEGLGYVMRHPLLRPIALCTSSSNLATNTGFAIYVLFAVRELGLSPALIGLVFALGSIFVLAGALAAPRIALRIGVGPSILLGIALTAGMLLVPLAQRSNPLPPLIAAQALISFGVIYNINQVSLRQAITPLSLQGRMNASMRFIVWGTIPVGTLLGGILGSAIGLRPTLWVSAVAALGAPLFIVLSPVRELRTIEEAVPAGLDDALAAQAVSERIPG